MKDLRKEEQLVFCSHWVSVEHDQQLCSRHNKVGQNSVSSLYQEKGARRKSGEKTPPTNKDKKSFNLKNKQLQSIA